MGSAITQRRFGTGGYVFDETPSGSINGSNTVYTTASSFASNSLRVYKNGVRMEAGSGNDFTITGNNQFTMAVAPATDTKLLVDYQTVVNSSGDAATVGGYEYDYLRSPIGSIMDYAGLYAPENWLLCYGQAVSRTTYAQLFSAISTTYGSGDGSTTFNLPDCRGRVVAGKDDMGGTSANRLTAVTGSLNGDNLGATGGGETHSHTLDAGAAQIGSPSGDASRLGFTISQNGTLSGSTYNVGGANTTTPTTRSHNTKLTGSTDSYANIQPTIIFNKIIRAL